MVDSLVGYTAVLMFVIAYLMISFEEKTAINKSKPALLAGTLIYVLIAWHYNYYGIDIAPLKENMHRLIVDIASIYFFLFVAMTYIESLIERGVFEALKFRLLQKGYNYKKLFWATGLIAFFLSPVADNLTTALVLSTVLLTLEHHNRQFLILGAINIVVAANAGGAWSPFGDITTLMVWTTGKATFAEFLFLLPASFIGWAATAYLLSNYLPDGSPADNDNRGACRRPENATIKKGGLGIILLAMVTIIMAVTIHNLFHLPAFWGMMLGLGLFGFYSSYLKKKHNERIWIYRRMAEIENDTLLFFFGLLAAVSGLAYLGYIAIAANIYDVMDPFWVNVLIGVISAVIDNIPLMFAVLKADPVMDTDSWLLVTLTAGIGGSLISFGSAAGVGVMGKLRGIYTVGTHMKYAWTIALGYMISVGIFYLQFEMFGFSLSK
ncbi:MAG: sodium:proton antiporter NhaD [Thiovulaceae bacterium]|nr:sodium:proton antiporter NhaD [Sulfurimonadaceae bacterium]